MKKYSILLLFIIISQIGTTMTSFSLGIWTLDKTGDSTLGYALISFLAIFPQIIFGPILGSVVDRWSKKKIIIYGQLVAALGSVIMILLYLKNNLELEFILLVIFFSAIVNGLTAKAFYVSAVTLVGKKRLSNAKGLEQTAFSLITVFIPIIAPITYHAIGLDGIFMIDVFSFSISILGFMLVKMKENRYKK